MYWNTQQQFAVFLICFAITTHTFGKSEARGRKEISGIPVANVQTQTQESELNVPFTKSTQVAAISLLVHQQIRQQLNGRVTSFNPQAFAVVEKDVLGENVTAYYVHADGGNYGTLTFEAQQFSSGDVELHGVNNIPPNVEMTYLPETARLLVDLVVLKRNNKAFQEYTKFDPISYRSSPNDDGKDYIVAVDIGDDKMTTVHISLRGHIEDTHESGRFNYDTRLACLSILAKLRAESDNEENFATYVPMEYSIIKDADEQVTYQSLINVGSYTKLLVKFPAVLDVNAILAPEYTYVCGTDNVPCGSPIPPVFKYYSVILATAPLAAGGLLSSIVTAWNDQIPAPTFTITLSSIASFYIISLTITSPPPTGVDWEVTAQLFLSKWSDGNQHTATVVFDKYSTGSITFAVTFP